MNRYNKKSGGNAGHSAKYELNAGCVTVAPKNRLCIVQFPHPGGEYPISVGRLGTAKRRDDGRIDVFWNRSYHHRRLVRHRGGYVDKCGVFHESGDLCFWTEWEAETIATETCIPSNPLEAQYIHEVICPARAMPIGVRGNGCRACDSPTNTDPCVFGKNFKYCFCRQTGRDANWLRHLMPGSLIVFWSQRNDDEHQYFCLDTVFVVGNEIKDYLTGSASKIKCSTAYNNLTLDRLPVGGEATFYRGVAFEEELNKPVYSFTPAKIYGQKDYAKRCFFTIDDVNILNAIINKDAGKDLFNVRAIRRSSAVDVSVDCVKTIWQKIKDITISKGFVLGVGFDWPMEREYP